MSLAAVRTAPSADAVLERAPRELCAAGVFERVMISRVTGSTWSPTAVYGVNDQGQASLRIEGSPDEQVEDLRIPLASPLVEAEVVRRRLPALVQDAQDEPRVYRPLIELMHSQEYVVAPIVTGSVVVGLVHADRAIDSEPLIPAHRDLLRMFADGVGLAYERALLIERIERQRQYVIDVCQSATESVSADNFTSDIVLGAKRSSPPDTVRRDYAQLMRTAQSADSRDSSRLMSLTSREREVLGLLASGATNAQLADQLTVAESTVKSHVKHILHKLGAGNRAAAISFYLRDTRDKPTRR